jgi:hypothetical protein
MTRVSAGTAPLSTAKDGYVPVLDCTFTPVGSLDESWLMSAAVARWGKDHVPLPLPEAFATQHREPEQVNLRVLQFVGGDQPLALLTNPDFANSGWQPLPVSIRGGKAYRSPNLDRPTWGSYIVQFPSGSEWVELSAFGPHLTIVDVRAIAERVGTA